ncbi:MAG: hypothetical protein HDR29_05750 [Lachnospiraceae bacterium]|nr:hypothetical protein [Lachnospiraceae bacterium]
MLLIKANPELKNVFKRLIKTMDMPVTWNDILVVTNNYLILAGDVRSLVFNFDNTKIYTTILEIPPESAQLETLPSDAFLNNVLNITIYAFGKWGSINGLKVDKDYKTLNALFSQIFRPVSVEPEFGENNFRFYKSGMQITYEDAVIAALKLLRQELKLNDKQTLITAEASDNNETASKEDPSGENDARSRRKNGFDLDDYENDYEIGLWHNLCWKKDTAHFTRSPISDSDSAKSRIGNNFYMTNYLCPKCEGRLYLGVYPVDKELLIETEEGRVFMARTYACHNCNILYTPRPQKLLQEGDVYNLNFDNDRVAYEDYLDILGYRAERTTNPNFNEFESERNRKKDGEEASNKDSGEQSDQAKDGNTVSAPLSKMKSIKEKLSKGGSRFFSKNKEKKVADSDNADVQDSLTDEAGAAAVSEGQNTNEHTLKSQHATEHKSEAQYSTPQEPTGQRPESKYSDNKITEPKRPEIQQPALKHSEIQHSEFQNSKPQASQPQSQPVIQHNNVQSSDSANIHASPSAAQTEPPSRIQIAQLSKKTTDELKAILSDLERKGESDAPEQRLSTQDANYTAAVRTTLKAKLTAKYDARMNAMGNLSLKQLSDLKKQIEKETVLAEDKKEGYIKNINSLLYKAEAKALEQKVELSKNKTYAEIEQIIKDVKNTYIPDELKQETLDKLNVVKSARANREAEYLLMHMPLHMDRKQLSAYLDKLDQYKEVDLTPYRTQIDHRMDMAEKEEISAMMKRGGKKDRNAWQNLYEELKERDYKEENKAPFLEKIYDKIRQLDEDAIERICPSIVTLSFEEGLKAYEEISQGMFLPELKTDTLEMIKRRLTKLKTDESTQLMRKLKNDMDEKMPDYDGFYFYNAREEMKLAQGAQSKYQDYDDETENDDTDLERERQAMFRAIDGYAAAREEYEYPLMVCDTSRARNGKEGFVLTPDHIFYHTFLKSGKIKILDINKVKSANRFFSKGVYIKHIGGGKEKLPNNVISENWEIFAKILDDFATYLKEKPESRNIEYMAKEKHDVIHCYRCGFVYKNGNVCPKCGSKTNR